MAGGRGAGLAPPAAARSRRVGHDLERLAAGVVKRRPQRLVPPDDFVERSFERVRIELSGKKKGPREMVGGAGGVQPVEEPEPLLGERERDASFDAGGTPA